LPGIDRNGGAFTPVQFDERPFPMLPGGDAERAKSSMTPSERLPVTVLASL
jgi:hypothetical protein